MNIRRRTLLQSMGVAGIAITTGCIGTNQSAGKPGEYTKKESLTDHVRQNHLHGITYDHENDQLYLATHHGLFVLRNDAALYLVGDSLDDFMGFSMHPAETAVLYRSGHPKGGGNLGVERSADGGMTWTQIFTGVADETVDFHVMAISNANPKQLLGFYHGNLYVTDDAGDNWRIAAAKKLPTEGTCWGVPCLSFDPNDSETMLAGTQNGLYESTDLGERWRQRSSRWIAAVTADLSDPSVLFGATRDGIVRSSDRGDTWTVTLPANNLDTNEYVFEFAPDRGAADVVYAGTSKNRVLKTTDGGSNWRVMFPQREQS